MIKDYIYILIFVMLIVNYILLLKKMIQERKYFINTLSHDFRVALLAQIRALNLLQNKLCTNKSVESELVAEMNESSMFSLDLVNTLINTYKYKNKEQVLNYEKFNMNEVINNINNKFLLQIESKNLKIHCNLKEFVFANADKIKLSKAIEILFLTAIYNANKNSAIAITIENKSKNLKILIVYDGIRLTDEEVKRMFSKNTNFSVVGHGVRLHLCKNIIAFHKGKINVGITETKKTYISFVIPNKQDQTLCLSPLHTCLYT